MTPDELQAAARAILADAAVVVPAGAAVALTVDLAELAWVSVEGGEVSGT